MTTTDQTAQRERLRRRGLALAVATIAWNLIEGIVAVTAGIAAGSIALVGFGIASAIEVASSVIIVWQFSAEGRHGIDTRRERRALRLIAISFYGLAAYVSVQAIIDFGRRVRCIELTGRHRPGRPLPSRDARARHRQAKNRNADGIPDPRRRLRRDDAPHLPLGGAAHRPSCNDRGRLSLAGWCRDEVSPPGEAVGLPHLVLDAVVGWWWADPLAALVIAGLATKEGRAPGKATPIADRNRRTRPPIAPAASLVHTSRADRRGQPRRLRQRGLGRTRSLGARGFSLGIEALERFVAHEPLHRMHDASSASSPLESEPVGPRL